MGKVADFERELFRRSPQQFGNTALCSLRRPGLIFGGHLTPRQLEELSDYELPLCTSTMPVFLKAVEKLVMPVPPLLLSVPALSKTD